MIISTMEIVGGGTHRQIAMLAHELVSRGHEVKIYTLRYLPELAFPELMKGLQIISLDREYSPSLSQFFRVRFIGTFLHQWLENRQCRMLALHMDKDFDVLNPHDQMSMRVAYYYKKLVRDIPSAALMSDMLLANWSYADDEALRPPHRTFIQRCINWLRDDYQIRKFMSAQEVIAVLNYRTEHIASAFLQRTIRVTRTAVDASHFPYKERKPIQKGSKIKIMSHNVFFIHRRFEDTIRAVALLNKRGFDVHLTISGDYSIKDTARAYYARLQDLVRELGVRDRVVFRGPISSEELVKIYHESDIFVSANHLQTWGIAGFEALSTGLPVVISNTIGASEVLTHGENALLFEALNPHSLAEQIERLIREPELYLKISKTGRDFVHRTITWQRHADDFERFFAEAKKIHSERRAGVL